MADATSKRWISPALTGVCRKTQSQRAWDGKPERLSEFHGANGSNWSDYEWINCHDGKARRTKPGIRMLVDGMAGRIHLWRLAGNSINPVEAAEVLKALMETETAP
jgi:DNA (cytosine-5)-methyltransferase 1